MATSLYEKKVQITLELNQKEAEYIREVMRNPTSGCDPNDEDAEEAEIRADIFNALDGAITELDKLD